MTKQIQIQDSRPAQLSVYSTGNISLQDSLKQQIINSLRNEILYSDIMEEFESSGVREIVRGNLKFRIQRDLLVQHEQNQDEQLDYWRIVIPDHTSTKDLIIRECHSIPYAAHPGIQRTVSRVRKSFVWKGMSSDIRRFVENCPTCQLEKTDHVLRRGHLQSLAIPEAKWQDVSIDFITDLPTTKNGEDSIMVVVDRASKMVHLVPCRKTITAGDAAKLYWKNIVKLHGVPRAIHSDRGAQFIGAVWREIWSLMGTSLRYGTAYHPQSQGQVERMNSVVEQMLRCFLSEPRYQGKWKTLLPTAELAINSLPNRSTGYSPFYLMYGYNPVLPIELVKGDELVQNEQVSIFLVRMQTIWQKAQAQLQRSIKIQEDYYNRKHRDVRYVVDDWVLLSTQNLKVKGVPRKLQRRFCGPFKILKVIGTQAYQIELPAQWRIHDVFHVSLLKKWNASAVQESDEHIEL